MKKKTVPDWTTKRGRCKGGGRSSKAKGRTACLAVQELLLDWLPLRADDVLVKATSQGGVDIHLSPAALAQFPYGIEVKNKEKLNIFAALQQAAVNANGHTPIVFFKKAHTPLFVAVEAKNFMRLIELANILSEEAGK